MMYLVTLILLCAQFILPAQSMPHLDVIHTLTFQQEKDELVQILVDFADNHDSYINSTRIMGFFEGATQMAGCNMTDCMCLTPMSINKVLDLPTTAEELIINNNTLPTISVLLLNYFAHPTEACADYVMHNKTFPEVFSQASPMMDSIIFEALYRLGQYYVAMPGSENENEDDGHDDHGHDDHGHDHAGDEVTDEEEEGDDHDDHHHHDHAGADCVDLRDLDKILNMGFLDVPHDEVFSYISTFITVHLLTGKEFRQSCEVRESPRPDAIVRDLHSYIGDESDDNLFDFAELLEMLNIGGVHQDSDDNGDDHGHDHDDDHSHMRKRRNAVKNTQLLQRKKRSSHSSSMNMCYSAEDMLSVYGLHTETEGRVSLDQMTEMCPLILQQQVSGACTEDDHGHDDGDKSSDLEVYGYSILAVLITSLVAFLGIAFYPCLDTKSYKFAISYLIALAVGTLTGDTLLHLVPAMLGLHSHDHGASHSHDDSEGIVVEPFVWKALTVLGALFGFFIFESMMGLCCGHSHDHDISKGIESAPEKRLDDDDNSEKGCGGTKPVAWMVLIGDSLHNFADGMAIGAAFTVSPASGISTSLAVLCHEVSHEIGDFAVLINSGFSIKRAAALNFITALTALVGAVVGVAISVDQDKKLWIFAVASGMFFYIALANMIPELVTLQRSATEGGCLFILQMLGFLTGVAIMTLIVIFESEIKV